jgi:hypothetical protein
MKVWVEDSAVEDINGKLFTRTGGGTSAGGEPENGGESARGWHAVGAAAKPVIGADLPKRIYVRWQSIVEPQTYKVWLDVPEEARQLMVQSVSQRCPETPEEQASYSASIYLGLAPGGVVQVFVRDECHRPFKVARAQAEVEPLGLVKVRTKGAMRISSAKSPSDISRNSAYRTGVGRSRQETLLLPVFHWRCLSNHL